MTNSKAPWLARGSAIALMMAAGIALAACGGGGGLNEDESATLEERLEDGDGRRLRRHDTASQSDGSGRSCGGRDS